MVLLNHQIFMVDETVSLKNVGKKQNPMSKIWLHKQPEFMVFHATISWPRTLRRQLTRISPLPWTRLRSCKSSQNWKKQKPHQDSWWFP
jgi:hypothetical protein